MDEVRVTLSTPESDRDSQPLGGWVQPSRRRPRRKDNEPPHVHTTLEVTAGIGGYDEVRIRLHNDDPLLTRAFMGCVQDNLGVSARSDSPGPASEQWALRWNPAGHRGANSDEQRLHLGPGESASAPILRCVDHHRIIVPTPNVEVAYPVMPPGDGVTISWQGHADTYQWDREAWADALAAQGHLILKLRFWDLDTNPWTKNFTNVVVVRPGGYGRAGGFTTCWFIRPDLDLWASWGLGDRWNLSPF